MATSIEEESNADDQEILKNISAQFFQMVPVRRMNWGTRVINCTNIGPEEQRAVLRATVLSPLVHEHPPSVSYRRAFLKHLMHKLEDSDAEMCDEIYEVYTDLLQEHDMEDDTLCYKTYFLPNDDTVILQESVHLISQGTTGLSTWQAALHLAEWSIENKSIFEKRNVLELGSGLGLTGITICKQCQISSFTFSDCHPQVLYLLMKNIEINFLKKHFSLECSPKILESPNESKDRNMLKKIRRQLSVKAEPITDDSSDIMEISYNSVLSSDGLEEEEEEDNSLLSCDNFLPASVQWNTTNNKMIHHLRSNDHVKLMSLDWESSNDGIQKAVVPEVIVGADIVYDKSVIPALISVMKMFLSIDLENGEKPVAYIASTIRNEDTRDHFLIVLGNECLAYEIVEPPKERIFYYDNVIPIEILKIWQPSKNFNGDRKG